MNGLTYTFSSCEHEGEKDCQMLNAEVWIDKEPDEDIPTASLSIWHSFPGIEEIPKYSPLSEKTAIALRDFLNFCFPLDGKT